MTEKETSKGIIEEWNNGYDENHPIFFESIERLKSMLFEYFQKEKAELEEVKEGLERAGNKTKAYVCGEDFEYWDFPSENQKIFHELLKAKLAQLEKDALNILGRTI